MRKVKFPFEFDVLAEDMVTEELRKKLAPVNGRLREIEKERAERRKVRRRTKMIQKDKEGDVVMGDAPAAPTPAATDGPKVLQAGDLPDEKETREKEFKELDALVDPSLKEDIGSNVTGMYELCALVTHKGASADGGHYIAWVRKDELQPTTEVDVPGTEEWFKFDDDKVSVVTQDKITSLDGGGEDSTAYLLLYRSKKLD